jgi:hypothetical protein
MFNHGFNMLTGKTLETFLPTTILVPGGELVLDPPLLADRPMFRAVLSLFTMGAVIKLRLSEKHLVLVET